MRTTLEDGRLQVTAAISLLETSLLVEWNAVTIQFQPTKRDLFESAWSLGVHPVFGRLICWIIFAAGAEFLAKGVCLLNGVDIRKWQEVPLHPQGGVQQWAPAFLRDWKFAGTMKVAHFGTIATLTGHGHRHDLPPALKRLCSAVGAGKAEEDLLIAAYEFLRRTIRNRDAHAYVPNVRDSHFSLVPELFCGCFNTLVQWLPGGPSTINIWKVEANSFIASL